MENICFNLWKSKLKTIYILGVFRTQSENVTNLLFNFAKRTLYHLSFRKDCVTSFLCSFLCLQITAKISKIKKQYQRDLYLYWLMESLFKYKCYETGYAELSEKSDSFQEIPAPKKVFLLKK